MTPQQKIKCLILTKAAVWAEAELPVLTADNIDAEYDAADQDEERCDDLQDARNEVRHSGIPTDLPAPSSRHYEGDAVAAKLPDGSWVGWTYWHGGGKHGEPEAIDWIEYAYDVICTEEEKMVVVRNFSKVAA